MTKRRVIPMTAEQLLQSLPISCESCHWWDEQTDRQDEYRWGECHRNPPQLVMETDPSTGEQCPMAYHPPTSSEMWCGEYRGRQ